MNWKKGEQQQFGGTWVDDDKLSSFMLELALCWVEDSSVVVVH
jgi:hypothetical protein